MTYKDPSTVPLDRRTPEMSTLVSALTRGKLYLAERHSIRRTVRLNLPFSTFEGPSPVTSEAICRKQEKYYL